MESYYPHQTLKREQVEKHMSTAIEEVCTLTSISKIEARLLLDRFQWDTQVLMERYYEDDLLADILTENRIDKTSGRDDSNNRDDCDVIMTDPDQNTVKIAQEDKYQITQAVECQICCVWFKPYEYVNNNTCNHKFCGNCWETYLKTKILSEGEVLKILCPAFDCQSLVSDLTLITYIRDNRVQTIYNQLLINKFVESNKFLRWCPADNCTNAIKVSYAKSFTVTCTCRHKFCFSCGGNWHEPIKCELLEKWQGKVLENENADTYKYLQENTKKCPACKIHVQKDHGCNFVICKYPSCRILFCWGCLKPRNRYHISLPVCFNWSTQKTFKAISDKETQPSDRFTLFKNNFESHSLPESLIKIIREKVGEKLDSVGLSWFEQDSAKSALEVFFKAKHILKYSYAFGFFLKANNQQMLFTNLQKDLEMVVMDLDNCFKGEMNPGNWREVQMKLVERSYRCVGRCKALVEIIHDGYLLDKWEFLEAE